MLNSPSIHLHRIREGFGLSYERMGRLVRVSGRIVERMESLGRHPRNAAIAERLGLFAQIVELGQLVFKPEGWRQFLTLPQPRFGGRTAL
jgi:hypothetical protein